jgi:hypothetical protein
VELQKQSEVVLDQLVGIDLRKTVVVLVARRKLVVLVVEDLHIVVAKPAAVPLVAILVVPPVVR